jgi:hypothetical protein
MKEPTLLGPLKWANLNHCSMEGNRSSFPNIDPNILMTKEVQKLGNVEQYFSVVDRNKMNLPTCGLIFLFKFISRLVDNPDFLIT